MSVPSQTAIKYFELLPTKLKNFFNRYPPHIKYADKPVSTLSPEANPFLPNKHPVTNRYHDPVYSRRRMSDIYKLAHRYGVQDMLPPITNKQFFEEKYENKKFMKGVLYPKGHKYELSRADKLKAMEAAIQNADNEILKVKGKKFARRLKRKEKEQITWI